MIAFSPTSKLSYTIYEHSNRVSVGISISPLPSATLEEIQNLIMALQIIESEMSSARQRVLTGK